MGVGQSLVLLRSSKPRARVTARRVPIDMSRSCHHESVCDSCLSSLLSPSIHACISVPLPLPLLYCFPGSARAHQMLIFRAEIHQATWPCLC